MKKQGKTSRSMVVWLMMMIILAHANLSIAVQYEGFNGTSNNNNNNFGVIENEFDSDEFPDATSSHFRRVLAQVQSLTLGTSNANRPAVNAQNTGYRGSSPISKNGGQGCGSEYNRAC